MSAVDFLFGPAVRLRVLGPRPVRAHFAREFGPAQAPGDPDVEARVRFARDPGLDGAVAQHAGGHKSARWRVALAPPGERPLRAGVALQGGPPSFAVSLVQGYHVEPLVAVALARAGFVALPGAAVVLDGGALVLLGGSGTGKSSLSVRALARGRALLGDDQVILAPDGGCFRYPRRLRLYPDVAVTAPAAWSRLRPRTRRTLRARSAIRRATRGYVAPSLAVATSEVGAPAPPGRVPARGLVTLERSGDVRTVVEDERDAAWGARAAAQILAEQRARFAQVAADAAWAAALDDVARREAAVLERWLRGVTVTRLRVPRSWDAATAVDAVARGLGIDA